MLRPGLGRLNVFNETGLALKRKTNGAQQPFVSFSPINAHLLFVAATSPAAKAAAAKPFTGHRSALGIVAIEKGRSGDRGRARDRGSRPVNDI
jgi:hypothetical protein